MPLSDSSREKLVIKPEASFGVINAVNACYQQRFMGESLKYAITTETSKEIRDDRQTTDEVITGAQNTGGYTFELSYAEYDKIIEAALQGTIVAFGVNGVGAVIPTSAVFAASTLTAGAATSGASIFTALVAGQFIKVAGSSIAGQNIIAQVSKSVAPTATVLTFEGAPFTALTGNGGAAVTISGSQIRNGVAQRSFTIEKSFTDIGQTFTYTGETVDNFNLDLKGGILTGSVDFMGKTMTQQVASLLNATVTSSTSNPVMNSVNNIGNILEGGVAFTNTAVKEMTLPIKNQLRGKEGLGFLGNFEVGSGTLEIKGTLSVYFADAVLYQKFLTNSSSSLSFRVIDNAGNGYVITLPFIKYSDATIAGGSMNSDMMVDMNYTAMRDPVTGRTIIIDRVGAAVVPMV